MNAASSQHRQSTSGTSHPRLPGVKWLPRFARRRLRQHVLRVISHDQAAPDYDHPHGDPGLFGPDSVTWKIHADFPSMMAGGLASLMLQSLHPLALAGVWDHSTFRRDTLGRLRRTTAFVGRTTYAPRAPALAIIDKVNQIHAHVQGKSADGRPYSALDPQLLTWVHCAECWCFMRAYETYCHAPIPQAMQNRYLTEMATLARALGADDVPQDVTALHAYFEQMQDQLCFDERSREVLHILTAIELPIPMQRLSRGMFFGAAATVLPPWALQLMERTPAQRRHDRRAAFLLKAIAPSMRDAMSEGGLAWRACRRTDANYEALFQWP